MIWVSSAVQAIRILRDRPAGGGGAAAADSSSDGGGAAVADSPAGGGGVTSAFGPAGSGGVANSGGGATLGGVSVTSDSVSGESSSDFSSPLSLSAVTPAIRLFVWTTPWTS